MKLCVDCKWHHLPIANGFHFCTYPAFQQRSPVTGEPIEVRCASARNWEHLCGEDGLHWEAIVEVGHV